ncbi:hypothetical protein SAMN05444358_111113 [Ruegeria halocynthiae]|uniref:Dolichyl-phosphate-mannose-protein mannosyltransferase n=1 Tax=Ruegeria halocynthiae TaxID=985054 RepID=A0A1H3EKZ9_9RHOB|nr:hypothetical protein [Ruegeria halocynthiae]SDX79371.1 hypothetical protein SAMN05444358_111113 [Ruegeria halocynthiae]
MPDALKKHPRPSTSSESDYYLLGRYAIAVLFLLLTVLAYTQNVNWDEFYFLSHVHAFLDGRLDRPLQTFFVHGFAWLGKIPGHEMGQIFAARLVMIGFLAATCFSIYKIAEEFSDQRCSIIAVLAFLTSAFVLPHGASFRADPIAAAFLTSSIAIILTTRMSVIQIVLVALLSALAVLVTIKSALYLPAYFAALIWRIEDRSVVLRIIGAGILSAALCALLYLWHSSGISVAEGKTTATNAKSALNTTFLNSGWVPRSQEVLNWFLFSLAQVCLVVLGLTAQGDRRRTIVLLLFAGPFLSVVVYRNAYVYFFPFAVPLLMVAAAIGAQRITQTQTMIRIMTVMLISTCLQLALVLREGTRTRTQRATIAEVHRLFESPVPYIDDSGMIASFPRVGFFMSSWGLTSYRRANQPVFVDIIRITKPPLLIANKVALTRTMAQSLSRGAVPKLLPEDHDVLRRSYVHYAGVIWLAGAEVALTADEVMLNLPFPGRYRVEANQPIKIDDQMVTSGTVLALGAEPLELKGPPGTSVKLIWDTGVEPIPSDSLGTKIYSGFWMFPF